MPDPSSGAGFPAIIERVVDVASGTVTIERQHDTLALYIDTLDMSAMIGLTVAEASNIGDILKAYALSEKHSAMLRWLSGFGEEGGGLMSEDAEYEILRDLNRNALTEIAEMQPTATTKYRLTGLGHKMLLIREQGA